MGKSIRILIAIALMLGIAILARNNVAWAGPTAEVRQSAQAQDEPSVSLAKPEPGTVKPPPAEITVCEDGIYSVGGVATLRVNGIALGHCLAAFLRNHGFALGRIPDGAGEFLANITFIRAFDQGSLIYELPAEDGDVQICYAVPPGTEAQIYFFDFYGPRFGERTGQPSWEPLETTVENGIACAPAQTSGAYALIGQ